MDIAQIRARLVAYQSEADPVLLDEAIRALDETVSSRPGFFDLADGERAFVWTLGAAALTLRARTGAARPDDLDRSIIWGESSVAAWPQDDANLPPARSNLATALIDRYMRESDASDPHDLARALELFELAVPALRATGARIDISLHSYGCCYHERATMVPGRGIDDLDRAIELFSEALEQTEPAPEERAAYLNSLGISLRAKAMMVPDPRLLARACDAYVEARQLANPGAEAHMAASVNLAIVLQDRAEADNDLTLLRQAVEICRETLALLDPANEQLRQRVTTNLASALIDLYRYSRDLGLLTAATRELRVNAERQADGPVRQTMLANLGVALHETFDYTAQVTVLDQAIAVQQLLLDSPDSAMPERMLNLGVSLLARFRRRRAMPDLERAIDLFEEAARTAGSGLVRASALNSHANARSLRFDETRDKRRQMREIDRCIVLRENAVQTAPRGSLDRAMYESNLGVDLLKRYELARGIDDLDRAIACQNRAVRTVPPDSTDQPRLLAGLADSLAQRANHTGTPGDVDAARSTYRRSVNAGRESLPEQALGAAIRWGDWESGGCRWGEAVDAYTLGLDALRQVVATQLDRADKEGWLADARGLPSAAALAGARAGDLERAVLMMEDGRAVLLAEALAQRRSVSARPLRAISSTG